MQQPGFAQGDWQGQPDGVSLALKINWPPVGQIDNLLHRKRKIRQFDVRVRVLGFVVDHEQEAFVLVGADGSLDIRIG